MRYYLIAGEPSGDLHGANLMKGLKAHDPEAKFRFWGGDKMAGVGGSGNLAKHYKETSFFGIVEVIKNLRTIRRQMKECRQDVEAFAPDVLILVDYPGFNMKMARWAKEHGIRVFYYIAPKVWAWREWRVKAIRKYVDELFIIFPFERDYFPKHGIRPIFEGNPLVDAIEARRASLPSPDEFRRRHALDERPIVALLAGSRRSEIKANLPLMADLARKFPDRQFVVTGVSWLDRSIYEQYIADSGIRYVCDQTYETLAAAEAAVVTSGTATLETALLNVPEVVVYRTLWFQVKLQPYVLKVPYVSLVNLNLGRESVVEIIQSDLDITRAERELRAILTGGEKRERMLRDFAELQAVIGAPGASDRFAARMVELLKNRSGKMRELFTAYHTQLLGGGLSVLLGILVRFFPNLIVGYNTMSAEQKKNVDVKGLSRFMCLSLAAIGIGWIALGMLAGNLGGEKWVLAVDFLWLPAGCVFLLVKAQKYDRNK